MEHEDYLGNELKLGDEVVFMEVGYRNFERGEIMRLTKFTASIEWGSAGGYKRNVKQNKNQLIKIPCKNIKEN